MPEYDPQIIDSWALKKGFEILGLRYGIASSSGTMLDDERYFSPGEIYSQFTNWDTLEVIDYEHGMDAHLLLQDDPSLPFNIARDGSTLHIQGDLSRLEHEIQDRRWAILGNQGIWFRFALGIQEQRGIYGFHAASIYNPREDHLVLLLGKAGAGKSVYLLASIAAGWQIFSTEMTYFQIDDDGLCFLRGSLMDNIYVGSLLQDFPEATQRLGIMVPNVPDPWAHKISIDLHSVAFPQSSLQNHAFSILFPHVEKGLDCAVIQEIDDRPTLWRRLFENASEKISGSYLLHEQAPALAMDNPKLAQARLRVIEQLLEPKRSRFHSARVVSTGPTHCLEGLLP
jgi:hypothetical protein